MCNKFFNEIAKQPVTTTALVSTVAGIGLLVAAMLTLNVFLAVAGCCLVLLGVLLKGLAMHLGEENNEAHPLVYQPS